MANIAKAHFPGACNRTNNRSRFISTAQIFMNAKFTCEVCKNSQVVKDRLAQVEKDLQEVGF